ncbi:hypothetical protein BAY59_10655 [Prauserella coralliicola]|nr:hypothetical protein BAY59_10655 [Prauserella coralliicola]
MTKRKTDVSERLAEDIVSVLDYLSRVLQGAEEGNLYYLHDKAGGLERAARRLYMTLSGPNDAFPDPLEVDRSITFHPTRVQKLVACDARHYRVGRALYPETEETKARRVRIAADVARMLGGGR